MLLATLALPCTATPLAVTLAPATTRLVLTAYALGLLPVAGRFQRFSGQLTIDPADAGHCSVSLDVEVASLQMNDALATRAALGASLLDAAHYPRLHYAGTCGSREASGLLTLHGAVRPLTLTIRRHGNAVEARGRLYRTEYGVGGLLSAVGRTVDVALSVTVPAGLAAQLDRDDRLSAGQAGPKLRLGQESGSNFSAAPFMQ